MRQIQVQVAERDRETVFRVAREHGAMSAVALPCRLEDGSERALLQVQLPNRRVGAFVEGVERAVEHAEFVLIPRGTLAFRTPVSDLRDEVREVEARSTLELVLSSMQSVGSWKGLLLYALFSGFVAAYGALFGPLYLLTAAMLLAPLGAPAMVSAIGVTLGDGRIFRRGLVRFWTGVLVLVLAALGLGWAYGLQDATDIMERVSRLSLWTVGLLVIGGAAGAQALVKSDRDSLVTATATGFIVAVALSPPAAVVGLSLSIGRWDLVAQMVFTLVLTYAGVLLGAWASFALYGVGPLDETASRGSRARRTLLLAGTALATVGLVVWQAGRGPDFRKGDVVREAIVHAEEAVRALDDVWVLEVDARFASVRRGGVDGSASALLVEVVVARAEGSAGDQAIAARVRTAVAERLRASLSVPAVFVRVGVAGAATEPSM